MSSLSYFPTLLLLSVSWALFLSSSDSYFFPIAASPKSYKLFLGNRINLYFLIAWELHLRVFGYYFITHCQAGQLQTQMKRSFSFILKNPLWDRDTYGARQSGSRHTELLYQESLSKTVWSLCFWYTFRANYDKTGSWEKNKCYLLIPLQQKSRGKSLFSILINYYKECSKEGEERGREGQESHFIINWICMTADIIHPRLRRGWCNAVTPKHLCPTARMWHATVRHWSWEEHPKKPSTSGLQLPHLC